MPKQQPSAINQTATRPARGKSSTPKPIHREPSAGNVFADLELPNAGEHLVKAGLVLKVQQVIRQRKLTQSAAAEILGIDQPKISALFSGQFRGYSVERLMHFLVALGHDVEIVVKPKRHGAAGLRVA